MRKFRVYCKHSKENFTNAEEELKYFLKRIKAPLWKWKDRSPPPPEHAPSTYNCKYISKKYVNPLKTRISD